MFRALSLILTSLITIPILKHFNTIHYYDNNDDNTAIDNILKNTGDNITCFPRFQSILLSFISQLIDQASTAKIYPNDTYEVVISIDPQKNMEQIQSILSQQNFTDDNLFLIEDFLLQFLSIDNWNIHFAILKLLSIGLFLFCFFNFFLIFIFILKLSLFLLFHFKNVSIILMVTIKNLFKQFFNQNYSQYSNNNNYEIIVSDPISNISNENDSTNFIDEIDNEPKDEVEEAPPSIESIMVHRRKRKISEQSNFSTLSLKSTFSTISGQSILSPYKVQLPHSIFSYEPLNNNFIYIKHDHSDINSDID